MTSIRKFCGYGGDDMMIMRMMVDMNIIARKVLEGEHDKTRRIRKSRYVSVCGDSKGVTWSEIQIGAWIGDYETRSRDVFVENVVVGKRSKSQDRLGSYGWLDRKNGFIN